MIDSSPTNSPEQKSYSLPTNVRLGVTGHRTLENPAMICSKIDGVLADINEWFEGRAYTIEVLTSLADGADRLVPDCVLARAGEKCSPDSGASVRAKVELHAVLPMREDIYRRTFLGNEQDSSSQHATSPDSPSVKEFQALLLQATSTRIADLPKNCLGADPAEIYKNGDNRQYAYRWAGHYIVDYCDILLAIWNGKPESRPGSTAQVVEYAREIGRSVVWIHAKSGKVTWQVSGDDLASQFFCFRQYNAELDAVEVDDSEVERRHSELVREAERAGLATQPLFELRNEVLPRFLRARTLSAKYQSLYYRCGKIGYWCAALAVCTAAVLSMLLPENWKAFYLLEAAFILAAAMSGWLLKHEGWQRKWIDYRYLAERLRATCFLHIAGMDFEGAPSYPDTKFDWLPEGWVSLALHKVRSKLPDLQDDRFRDPGQVRALGAFLCRAWIDHQQGYYEKASEANKTQNERYEFLSMSLLASTLAIAVTYGVSALLESEFSAGEVKARWLSELPHIAAVAFPAITGAAAGIMIFRHFARNEERYSSMNHYLAGVSKTMRKIVGLDGNDEQVPDLQRLRSLVQDANRAMAHEHEGWRTVFGVRLPGPG